MCPTGRMRAINCLVALRRNPVPVSSWVWKQNPEIHGGNNVQESSFMRFVITGCVAAAGGPLPWRLSLSTQGPESFDRIDLKRMARLTLPNSRPWPRSVPRHRCNKDNAVSIAEIDASLQADWNAGATVFWRISMPTRTRTSAAPNSNSYIEAMVAGADADQ